MSIGLLKMPDDLLSNKKYPVIIFSWRKAKKSLFL